jgi:peptide/nickel transport system substrate-binding protein
LVIAVTTLGNETLDHIKGAARNEESIFQSLGEPLVGMGWDGPTTIFKPSIAKSWKVSQDLKTWEFTIRKDVKFHDGTPVTLDDVVYTWNRIVKSTLSKRTAEQRLIDSIESVGDDRIVFHLKIKYPFFLSPASRHMIQPKAYTEKLGEDEFGKHPIYAGSWKFVKQSQGDYVEMEAVEGHYRQTPHYKNLILKVVPESSTKLAMLKAGEAQILHYLQPGPIIREIKKDRELKLVSVPLPGEWYGYFINLTKPGDPPSPFRDKRVRHAVSHAIDRQLIIDKIFYGEGTPSSTTCIIPGTPQWDPSCTIFPYDVEKAKALLVEAGYSEGFTTKIITTAREKSLVEAIAILWAKIGIKAEMVNMETGAMLTALRKKTLPDGLRFSLHISNPMAMSYYFRKDQLYTIMNDEKLHNLTLKMMSFPEGPEMDKFVREEMCSYVHDLVPSLPLVNATIMCGVGPGLDIDEWVKMGTRRQVYNMAAEYIKPKR